VRDATARRSRAGRTLTRVGIAVIVAVIVVVACATLRNG
jgi:hypothetical protein